VTTYDWNKLSDKDKKNLAALKKVTFIAGPVLMGTKRIDQILTNLSDSAVLFGCLKDEWIPGLEGFLQFAPLKVEKLNKLKSREAEKLAVLNHFQKDLKYIIRELKPKIVVFINGSWFQQIHYRKEFWEAVNIAAKIRLETPFTSEYEAKRFAKKIEAIYEAEKLYSKSKKYSDKEIFQILEKKRRHSWDWCGQPTAALVRNGRILALTHNRVMPYQAFQMHEGSIREKLQVPAQEMIETHLTNHAEVEMLEVARRGKIRLENTSLYMNIFPCPVCAKMLARTPIKRIVYEQDHNLGNTIGYKVLEASGVKIRRVVA
jgi:dCMP deaminase